jgi:hypothetical protein
MIFFAPAPIKLSYQAAGALSLLRNASPRNASPAKYKV